MAVLLEIQKKKKEKMEESLWRLGKYDREKGLLAGTDLRFVVLTYSLCVSPAMVCCPSRVQTMWTGEQH